MNNIYLIILLLSAIIAREKSSLFSIWQRAREIIDKRSPITCLSIFYLFFFFFASRAIWLRKFLFHCALSFDRSRSRFSILCRNGTTVPRIRRPSGRGERQMAAGDLAMSVIRDRDDPRRREERGGETRKRERERGGVGAQGLLLAIYGPA